MDAPTGPQNPVAAGGFIGPTQADQLSPAFATALASPTGAGVQASSGGATNYYQQATPTSAVVSSSSPFQTQITNTQNTTNGLAGQTVVPPPKTNPDGTPSTGYTWPDDTTGHAVPYTGKTYQYPDGTSNHIVPYNANQDPNVIASDTAAKKVQTDKEALLQQQRDQEIKDLTTKFGTDKTNLQFNNDNETGGSVRNLMALQQGGQSASAMDYISHLTTLHDQSMTALQSQYDSAVNKAKMAYTDADFKLADQYNASAAAILKDANDRNDKFQAELNTQIDNARADAAQKFTEQQAVVKANTDNFNWARDNGLAAGAQFYASGGQIYFASGPNKGASAGSTPEELAANGVDTTSGTLSNVQMMTAKRTGDLGAMDSYNEGLKAEGKQPLDPVQWYNKQQQDKINTAAAGRSITVAQQQYDLTQKQTADLQSLVSYWQNNNLIAGNKTVSSENYKAGKQKFVSEYGSDAGPAYDKAMAVFVDATNQGGTKIDPKTGSSIKTPDYKADYGIN
jgi:hypothetical protein